MVEDVHALQTVGGKPCGRVLALPQVQAVDLRFRNPLQRSLIAFRELPRRAVRRVEENVLHFGIILICCCGIGFSTPPLGENMFIASGIANVSLEEISLKALPLVAINIAVIAILVMFPDIVLFLPNLMGTGLQ